MYIVKAEYYKEVEVKTKKGLVVKDKKFSEPVLIEAISLTDCETKFYQEFEGEKDIKDLQTKGAPIKKYVKVIQI